MKSLRVLALMHEDLVPPDDAAGVDLETVEWRTEYDVVSTLKKMGHEVRALGVRSDLGVIRAAIEEWKPHIAFNLLEEFDGLAIYDQNVVSYLELLHVPYTGSNPRGLMLSRDKALSKKVLAFHRIPAPDFAVMRSGTPLRKPRHLEFPLIVKSLTREASEGISQNSIVVDEDKLKERVRFIRERIGTASIVEKFIDGRELYVGVIGNQRPKVLPIWEIHFGEEQRWHIATERVKWNQAYQKRHGIRSGPAEGLAPEAVDKIQHLCLRAYKALEISGYARIDLRVDAEGHAFVLEANPNPQLARGEDFAESARAAGMEYEDLLQAILNLGRGWKPDQG